MLRGNCCCLLPIPLWDCTDSFRFSAAVESALSNDGGKVISLLKPEFPTCPFLTTDPRRIPNGEDSSVVLSMRHLKNQPRHLWEAQNTSKTGAINTPKTSNECVLCFLSSSMLDEVQTRGWAMTWKQWKESESLKKSSDRAHIFSCVRNKLPV